MRSLFDQKQSYNSLSMFATNLLCLLFEKKLNAAIEFLDFRPSEVAAAAAMSASISGEIKCIDDDKTLSNLTYVKQVKPI